MLIAGAIIALALLLIMLMRREQVTRLREYGVTKKMQDDSRYVEPDLSEPEDADADRD